MEHADASSPEPNAHAVGFAYGGYVYVRPPRPLIFPDEECVPETIVHLELRTALYMLLKDELAQRATVGSEQFVYWDPTDPRKKLAPDAMVRLGTPHAPFRSWKIWERGAPHLAVEIVSRSDAPEEPWEEKLDRYRCTGIAEIVRFDADSAEKRLRIWDAVDGDVIERSANEDGFARCRCLNLFWVVTEEPNLGPMLRLARDAGGKELLLLPHEARKREAEARKREAAGRKTAEHERDLARSKSKALEAEVAALRAQLGAGAASKPKSKATSTKKSTKR